MPATKTASGKHRIYEGRVVLIDDSQELPNHGHMIRCHCVHPKGVIYVPKARKGEFHVPHKVALKTIIEVLRETPLQTSGRGQWKKVKEQLVLLSESDDLLEVAACVAKLNNPGEDTLGKTEGSTILRVAYDRLILWLAVAHKKQPSDIVAQLERGGGKSLPVTYVAKVQL